MPLQDGFGDDRTDIDYEQYLLDNERLLKLKTGERMRGRSDATDVYADVLQEGRIVQWAVLKKRPDAPREYVSAAMSNRIIEVLTRGTWTGMETHRGRATDPLRRRDRDSVDDETFGAEAIVDQADVIEQVLQAYHDGEIHQALAALTFTQRTHVVLRFWGGMTNAEIAARQGCSKQTVERQWREDIRPQLVAQLGHLVNVC